MAGLSLVCGVGSIAARGTAQNVVAAQPQVASAGKAETTFSKLVSLQVHDVSLKQAIDSLALRAQVQIQYRAEFVNQVRKLVSVQRTRVPLGEVLDDLLAGTNLQAVSSVENVITIKPMWTGNRVAQGTIVGKIVHARTKAPLAGVTVTLNDAREGVQTAADGTFRMTAPTGNNTLRARGMGFTRQTQAVAVADDATVTVEFALEPSASVLDEVVVTGTVVATERKAITTPITVITAADIERRGITRMEQLFRGEVPGVMALERGSEVYSPELGAMATTQMFVRGTSSLNTQQQNPLKTYVDGIELLDPSYLGTLDPQSIDRIEIVTGPQAATIYGSGAMGGVMQIFTKKGLGQRRTDFTLALKYGTLQNSLSNGKAPTHAHTLTVMGGSGPVFSYSGNLSYNYSGQWQPGQFSRRVGGSIGVTHSQGRVTASGSVGTTRARNGTSYEYIPPYDAARIAAGEWMIKSNRGLQGSQRLAGSTTQTLALNLEFRVSESWQHHLTIGSSQTNLEIVPNAPVRYIPSDTLLINASSSGRRTSTSYNTTWLTPRVGILSQTLTLGGSMSPGNQIRVNGCTVSRSATTFLTCDAYPGLAITKDLDDESWGGFGSWRLGMWERLYVTLGLRGEHNTSYGRDHKIDWTPTNGIAYSVDYGDLTVKVLGSYGRSTRPPAPDQRLETRGGNTSYTPYPYITRLAASELTPEYSRGPQGGVELYYGNLGTLTINRYKQTISDLIQQIRVDSILVTHLSTGITQWNPVGQYQNTATIRQHGWEVTGSANIASFSLKGTYSWNDSRVHSLSPRQLYGIETYEGASFQQVPDHTASATVGYAVGGTSVTVVANYVGPRRMNTNNYELFYDKSSSRYPMYLRRFNTRSADVRRSAYTKSDLAVLQRLTPWVSATLNVVNLGNSFGAESDFRYPALGRQTTMGLSIRSFGRR